MLEVHRTHQATIRNHAQVAESLDRHGWSASKLWNVANYHSREVWEEAGEIPDHEELKDELKTHPKYKGLHSQSSQRVLEELAEAFNSWYSSDDDRDNPPGYRKRNYYDDHGTHERENPTMEDVLDILKALADGEDPLEFVSYQGDATELHREERDELDERVDEVTSRLQSKDDSNLKSEANSLLRSLEAFQPGGVAANLSGKTTVDLEDERLIVFDMSAFQDTNQAPLLQHVMLDWSYQRARENSRRMEVIFEEVHYLLSQKSARSLIGLFTRHSRHFNAGLTLISQTAEEFMQETDDVHSPRAIYDQCDIKQLFYQESISDEVIDYYDLSPADVEAIQSFARGQESEFSECLLSVTGIARRHLEIHASELTVDLLTEPETAAATAQLVEQRRQQAATARSEQTITQPEESAETAGGLGEEAAEKETTDSSTKSSETSEPPTDPITDGSGGSPSSGDTADDTNSD